MRRTLKVAAIAIGLFSSTAHASDWSYVTTTKDDSTVYIDRSNIRQETDAWREKLTIVWFKWDHSNDSTIEDDSSKELYYFKCEKSELKMVQFITYDAEGRVKKSSKRSEYQDFEGVAPDTIAFAMMEAACFQK